MVHACSGNCITCGLCATAPILEESAESGRPRLSREGYGIAIDLGTTTVVLALANLRTGKITARHSFLNPQRAFGADVISRIEAANQGHLSQLKQMIREAISTGIQTLLTAEGIAPQNVIDITIAGNTVMVHLLLGFPCESLGVVPFQITHTLPTHTDSATLFGFAGLDCKVHILPWMAAYVGGDITAGLLHVLPQGTGRFLLMDLGTNGEMALYDHGQLLVTATAAGPAFEQPVSSSQRPSLQGASAVISALAELVRTETMDETGYLEQEGVLSQSQVRELQLAKSAIRSGIEILLEIAGLEYADLDNLYLAGGIGQAMDASDAATIGLIPHALIPKAIPVGNAALAGAIDLLCNPTQMEIDAKGLLSSAKEVNLAAHPRFNDLFMEYMCF